MRIRDLETYVRLARVKHYGRVAAEFNTTQPAISSRISKVEEFLGVRLIQSSRGKFSLTSDGERVLVEFEAVLERLNRLERSLNDRESRPRVLRIGCIDAVTATWMPRFIDRLHNEGENISIELTVEGTKVLVEMLHKGQLDLIFSLDAPLKVGFVNYISCMLEMIWVGDDRLFDPRKTYSVRDIARLPIVTFQKNTPPSDLLSPYFYDEGVVPANVTTSNSLFAMISLLLNGYGIASIPTVSVLRELEQGALYPLKLQKPLNPMQVIGSYHAGVDAEMMRYVLSVAGECVESYSEEKGPGIIWTPGD